MKYSTFLKDNYDIVLDIIDKMRTGIWITDGTGEVIIVNSESVKTGGLTREEVIGRNMSELLDMGYITESAVMKTIGRCFLELMRIRSAWNLIFRTSLRQKMSTLTICVWMCIQMQRLSLRRISEVM